MLLAERMHWTLDYVDSMDVQDYDRVLTILDAVDKARTHVRERQARRAQRGGRHG